MPSTPYEARRPVPDGIDAGCLKSRDGVAAGDGHQEAIER